jgi:hypothetical protein
VHHPVANPEASQRSDRPSRKLDWNVFKHTYRSLSDESGAPAAYAATAWLQRADCSDSLSRFLNPSLTAEEIGIAKIEEWILGVV